MGWYRRVIDIERDHLKKKVFLPTVKPLEGKAIFSSLTVHDVASLWKKQLVPHQ